MAVKKTSAKKAASRTTAGRKPKAAVAKKKSVGRGGRRPRTEAATAEAPVPTTSGEPAELGSDVFNVAGPQAEKQMAPGMVELIINGRSNGRVQAAGQTLRQFVTRQAQSHGIRTFSVYVNSTKALTGQAETPIDQLKAASIEIVAKDSRGGFGDDTDELPVTWRLADGAAGAEAGKEGPSGPSTFPISSYRLPPELEKRILELMERLDSHQRREFAGILQDITREISERLLQIIKP